MKLSEFCPNKAGIHMSEYNVLVEPKEAEEKTAGGLFLPNEVQDKDQWAQTEGVLVAVSPMAFKNTDWPDDVDPPQVGDRVALARYAYTKIRGADGGEYWLMKDNDIMAVMETDSE